MTNFVEEKGPYVSLDARNARTNVFIKGISTIFNWFGITYLVRPCDVGKGCDLYRQVEYEADGVETYAVCSGIGEDGKADITFTSTRVELNDPNMKGGIQKPHVLNEAHILSAYAICLRGNIISPNQIGIIEP